MSAIEVHVDLDGATLPVGTLHPHRRHGTESATFLFSADYLSLPGAYALDPQLPLVSSPSHTPTRAAMFGAFRDSAPDRWGRTLIDRREAAQARADGRTAPSLGEVDYLLGVRDDLRQGALRFRLGPDLPYVAEPDVGVPALIDLPHLLQLAAAVDDDSADLDDLRQLVQVASSLGGARPKAHVRGIDGRIAIAKFPSARTDTWNVMAWEKVALDLASAAGITVPRSELLLVDGRQVLVVDRFDRTATSERRGYVSAMTMVEAGDGDRRSYLEIAEVIETRSASVTAELHELWRRIVFSVLISNTDDHLRNHGFLRVGSAWQLAPAFDLNPNPAPGVKFLSTSIDTGDSTADLSLALSVAGFFRLTDVKARESLAAVRSAVARWRDVAQSHGLSRAEIDRMRPAFIDG